MVMILAASGGYIEMFNKRKKPKETQKTCCFEWVNKKTNQPYLCGKPAKYIYQGKYYLCEECCKSQQNTTMLVRIS
jgi:hypothetical protein